MTNSQYITLSACIIKDDMNTIYTEASVQIVTYVGKVLEYFVQRLFIFFTWML